MAEDAGGCADVWKKCRPGSVPFSLAYLQSARASPQCVQLSRVLSYCVLCTVYLVCPGLSSAHRLPSTGCQVVWWWWKGEKGERAGYAVSIMMSRSHSD